MLSAPREVSVSNFEMSRAGIAIQEQSAGFSGTIVHRYIEHPLF
jgi:hypothetical protein